MTNRATSRKTAYVLLVLAGVVGGGGLFAFILFLFFGPPNIVNLGLDQTQALLFDTFLCLAFFTQHSGMARRSFHQRLARYMPVQYGGATYAISSGVVAFLLVMLWQGSPDTIVVFQDLLRLSLRVLFFLTIALVLWTLGVGFLALYRLRPIVDDLRGSEPRPKSLITRGPYRWVRHPLYLSSLLLLWSHPSLTIDRLLLNILFSIWVIMATLLEDRDLVATFGDAYRSYQGKVGLLIPWRNPPGGA